jgi:hypothetical protein
MDANNANAEMKIRLSRMYSFSISPEAGDSTDAV